MPHESIIPDSELPSPASNESNSPLQNNQPNPTHSSDEYSNPIDPAPDPSYTSQRPTRARHLPSYLSDYVCNQSCNSSAYYSSGSLYPISHYHSYSHLSPLHHAYTVSLTHNTEPTSYSEACKHECWNKAMNDELEALAKTGTWEIVDLPPHTKPIGSKWVYKVKHKADGSIERYKARLVAKGYSQVEGLDFFDTFSPVAKLTTVRLLLAVASTQKWHLHQLDVNNAFLHGDLKEDVYMYIPDGVHVSKPNQVCKLLKSLYGLKQVSRKWYEKLTSLLVAEGYIQSTADHSLFTITSGSDFTALLVYVDDIILAGTSVTEIDRIKFILDNNFKIKDLGPLKYFLGFEVAQSREGITISQRKYCLDLLKDSGLLGSKPASTPLDPAVKLHNDDSKPYADISQYRRLVGKLLYLTNTRPDICFATQQLSQFLSKPTINHYNAACRVIRYLKHNPGRGLLFPRSSDLQILGFTDADWAGCLDTRKSTTGYCFFIGSSLVSWKAKKQTTVSRSSSEAEYRALSSATCELIWLLYLLNDLKIQCSKPPVIYCDSQSALHIASNLVFHERTKHLEIDCHLVREKLQQGLLRLLPISTEDQLADCLTKPLGVAKFNGFIDKLGLIDIYKP
ncbi:putative mitochondrial protein [Trifolium repens]|nr:putative mitochondrial protein [Trifolium repens]